MTDHYVSFVQAKALKLLGFAEKVNHGYYQKIRIETDLSYGNVKEVYSKDPKNYNDNRKGIEFYSAPRLDQAAAWLREVKGIAISVQAEVSTGQIWYTADLCRVGFDDNPLVDGGFPFETYELAMSAGIGECLRILIREKQ